MEVGLAVGGAFLSSAFNVFFDRMSPKFPNLFRGRKGDEQLLKKLKTTLLAIHAVLNDAEDKQNTNRDVKEWVSELKDTVYHAEGLVDEISTEVLRLEVEGGERRVTDTVSQLSDEFLNGIIPKIEETVTTLEYFVSQINLLGLEMGVPKKENSYRLPSSSLVDESNVYGRDNEKEKLIQMVLLNGANGNDVSVISIVGMGGMGKTTLAQVVYGDERVKKHFDTRAWVCVSENYDAFRIAKTLVNEVSDLGSEEKDDFNRLQVKLKESLTEKKFLIVLDDIWNDNFNDWDTLMVPLKNGKKGSKIIVITRNENVAFMVRNDAIHHLERMSNEDCWSLFKKLAFDNGGPLASQEFEIIGKEIVKKCNGLPLAVKTLGGLLRSRTKVKEWDDILRSGLWTLEDKPNDVLPVLKVSYNHLLPHLKHCFAFCAVFPKNYSFDEEELILLWMANDLLQHPSQNDKTMEDVGHEYFSELRSRSFFQKVSDTKYSMHDLINDLARSVCEKFCVSSEDYQNGKVPSETRHFSYMFQNYNVSEKFKCLAQVKGLRTFLASNREIYWQHKLTKVFLSDILPGLRCLRVLSLCNYDIKELPHPVCNLKHLRYVNLSWTYITQLPNAICSLHNLQTLLLIECRYLRQLPINLTKLVNLRHLDLRATELTEMPSHMSRLKSLQTLSCFIVCNSPGRSIEELGKLHLRGYLKIMGLQNVINGNDALKAKLRDKNHLEDLVLEWSRDMDDSYIPRDILDKLQPHTNLKSLTINRYGGTSFPHWLADGSFCNIVSLCLTKCMNCLMLPTLGNLPSLNSLIIIGLGSITKVGQEFYGDGSLVKPFQSLVTLRIEQMSELEEWDTSGNVEFSCLEQLYIKDCPKLIGELPSQLLRLKTFEISGCPKLVFPADWMTTVPQDNQVGLHPHLSSFQISNMPLLKELPAGFLVLSPKVMRQVNRMILRQCPSLVSFPRGVPSASIKELEIADCTKFEFPTGENSDGWYIPIEHLQVENAGDSFNDISLCLFPNLLSLELNCCENLKVFPAPQEIQNLTFLRRLKIQRCDNLLCFPKGGFPAPNLELFIVCSCKKLKSLPEHMHSLLPSLLFMCIMACPEIEYFPEGGLPSSLDSLSIHSCKKLMACRKHWGLERLPSLTTLSISGDDHEETFLDEWLLPCSLRTLVVLNHKNLKTLNQNSLLRLTSLETLSIHSCPKLVSLPKQGLPTSLKTLTITDCPKLRAMPTSLKTLGILCCPKLMPLPTFLETTSLSRLEVGRCPLLTPHLERERGYYWPRIAHIPAIVLDDELIS